METPSSWIKPSIAPLIESWIEPSIEQPIPSQTSPDLIASNLTPNNIAGKWEWKISKRSDYIQQGRNLGQQIVTDDGVARCAYAYSRERGVTLYDRPQHEWETPTETSFVYNFTVDGKFSYYAKLESGQIPHGYSRMDLFQFGSYRGKGRRWERSLYL